MQNVVGKALTDFEEGLRAFRGALDSHAALAGHAFEGTEDWTGLLTYKLVPHLAGEGCLVAAVTGGTNTGKSTVFNLLVGRTLSPIVNTAAATCHPVLAANEMRHAQCLEGKLVPEFSPRLLTEPGLAIDSDVSADTLLVAVEHSLPDDLVIMDTPDVDSIVRGNWEVADHIRAAGDVLIAVLTAEKYKDERVVEYFREAVAASRLVVPVMNKANPANDFEVARTQLDEFRKDVGTSEGRFVIAHDFDIAEDVTRPVASLDEGPDLRTYLSELDVPAIKEQVYRGTVDRFGQQASLFLARMGELRASLRGVLNEFEGLAGHAAAEYDPAPGKAVGGLFHEFVQSKRGAFRRAIGNSSAAVVRGAAVISRRITGAVLKRATLDVEEKDTENELAELHRQMLERITRDLVTRCMDTARKTSEPAQGLIADRFETLEMDSLVEAVIADNIGADNISEAFRQHANETLEVWWRDHKGKRRALEALDAILAVMPAAIAAPIALHTGGVGVSEAVVFAGPLAAQFITRVMEYQFGDALFDFLSPWRQEQQESVRTALMTHLIDPGLEPLRDGLEAFEGELLESLRRSLDQCLST